MRNIISSSTKFTSARKKKSFQRRLWRHRRRTFHLQFSLGKNTSLARKTPNLHWTQNGQHFTNALEPEPVVKPYEIRTFRSDRNLARIHKLTLPAKKRCSNERRRRMTAARRENGRVLFQAAAAAAKQEPPAVRRVAPFQTRIVWLSLTLLCWNGGSHARRRIWRAELFFSTLQRW